MDVASVLPPDEAQEFHRQLLKLLSPLPKGERAPVAAAIVALVQRLVLTNAGHLAEAMHTALAASPQRASLPPRGSLPPRASLAPGRSLRPSALPRARSMPPGPVISALPPPPSISIQPSWHPIAEVATAEIVDVISALLRPPRNLRLCRISGCPNVATKVSGATYRCDEHAESSVGWKSLKMTAAEQEFAHMSSRARRLVDRLKSG